MHPSRDRLFPDGEFTCRDWVIAGVIPLTYAVIPTINYR